MQVDSALLVRSLGPQVELLALDVFRASLGVAPIAAPDRRALLDSELSHKWTQYANDIASETQISQGIVGPEIYQFRNNSGTSSGSADDDWVCRFSRAICAGEAELAVSEIPDLGFMMRA
mmetsp:Transcript_65437/g.175529  ORF Transcript_65437/g.175529 Transcript_65437/m.175529 type:complete len:120 (+) Transcript_65437:64-423(+)